uniref:Uncharacterized protein n=1 Tax=Panagrolaimus sp. JU765 TaxID=591449 RepID=A0AC34QQI6_9BILA
MKTELQEAIVTEIQKVTSGASVEIQALELIPDDHKLLTVLDYLERVMKERDDYADGILEMTNHSRSDLDEIEYGSTGATTSSSSCNGDIKIYKEIQYEIRSPSPGALERHANLEIADLKAKIRNFRNELNDKNYEINQFEYQLNELQEENRKLKQEKLNLVKDARAARDYADEVEHLRNQLENYRKLEAENKKLRLQNESLVRNENWCAILEKDKETLQKSIDSLEDTVSQYQKRIEELLDSEHKLAEFKLAAKQANEEVELERQRIEELLIENGKLEREVKKRSMECADLEKQVEAMQEFQTDDSLNNSLFSEIKRHEESEILMLQYQNRELRNQLNNSTRNDDSQVSDLKQKLESAENKLQEKLKEIQKLTAELEAMKNENSEASSKIEVLVLEKEKANSCLNDAKKQLAIVQNDLRSQKEEETVGRKISELENIIHQKDQILSSIEDDKKRVETQLEKMRQNQKDSRNEMDALRDEVAKLEDLLSNAERMKKMVENERNNLKLKAESLEDKCDELNGKLVNYENLERRLANNEVLLAEKTNMIVDLEADNRTTKQQMELEMKKTQRMREDLVCEKSRIGDLLARLRSVCSAIRSHGGKLSAKDETLEDDDKLIDVIDDVIMQALNAARREADALRLQQQLQIAELDDLKKDIEALRRAEGELNESDDRVKELVMENKNVKEQVSLLQEKLRKLHLEDSTKSAEIAAAKREIEELQNKNILQSRHSGEMAKLQVQLRNAQVQEELLREDNLELQNQIEIAIKSKAEFEKKLQAIEATQTALIADYDRLQNLHQLLGADYDRAKFELIQLKQRTKNEKMVENVSRPDFVREKLQFEQILRKERDDAQSEIARLQKELDEYKRENSAMLRNTDERSDELRRLRVAECSQKTTINSLNGTIQQLNHVLSGKDMEIATLRRQVDMLRQYNGDENQSLIKQIELLLVKNQELHERSLNDKDTFHAVQRDLQEQLVTLRRNKEKLEEKIMDQYKSMDSRKIKEKQTFVKRAAKALMPRNPSKKAIRAPPAANCGSTTEDSSIEDANGFTSPQPQNGQCSSAQNTTVEKEDSAVHRFFRRSSLLRRTNPLPRRSTDSAGGDLPPLPSPLAPYGSLRIRSVPQSPGVGCCGIPSRRAPIAAVEDDLGLLTAGRPPRLNVPTTSCSSDLASSSSPDYEIFPITKSETVVCDDFVLNNRMRARNGLIGGSMRVSGPVHFPGLRASVRSRPTIQAIEEDAFSLNGSERGVDVPTPLMPNRIRQTRSVSNAASLHSVNSPRPPPYTLQASRSSCTIKHPPPPYPGRVQTPSSPIEFCPKDTSTPTPKEQPIQQRRGSGFYENVELPVSTPTPSESAHSRTGSAVWFEYGCV